MTELLTTRTPAALCPKCGDMLDAATGTGPSSRPKPHDLGCCISCGTILRFGADLRVRAASKLLVDRSAAEIQA